MKISHNLGVLLVTALLGGCFSAPVVSQQNTRSESVAVQQKQAKVYSATVSRVSDGDSLQVIELRLTWTISVFPHTSNTFKRH